MSNPFLLELITPERKRSISDVAMVRARLVDGIIGIFPGHTPLLAETKTAPLIYQTTLGEIKEIFLPGGILIVDRGKLTIYTASTEEDSGELPLRLLSETIAGSAETDNSDAKER